MGQQPPAQFACSGWNAHPLPGSDALLRARIRAELEQIYFDKQAEELRTQQFRARIKEELAQDKLLADASWASRGAWDRQGDERWWQYHDHSWWQGSPT